MIRKLIIALGAAATLAGTALVPTTASAWHHHYHGWRGGYGFGFYGPSYVAAPDCYLVKRKVQLVDGTWRWRRFTVCN